MVFEAVSTINDENGSNLKEILRFIEVKRIYTLKSFVFFMVYI